MPSGVFTFLADERVDINQPDRFFNALPSVVCLTQMAASLLCDPAHLDPVEERGWTDQTTMCVSDGRLYRVAMAKPSLVKVAHLVWIQ